MQNRFKINLPDLTDKEIKDLLFQKAKDWVVKRSPIDLEEWWLRIKSEPRTFIRVMHWVGEGWLKLRGFEFERRRSGDLVLGVWRKQISKKDRRTRTVSGEPRRIVVLPGFGDTPMGWMAILTPLIGRIKNRYDEMIWIDYPGFSGFLSHHRPFDEIKHLRETVAQTLATLKPEVVIGHSLGGYLAAYFAGTSGGATREVVLIDPSGMFKDDSEREVLISRFERASTEGFEHIRPHIFKKEPFLFRLGYRHFTAFIEREEIRQFLKSVSDQDSLREIIPKITSSLWILWGEEDSLLPVTQMSLWREAARSANRLKTIILPGVGHSPHVEVPLAMSRLLLRILRGQPIESRSGAWREWV